MNTLRAALGWRKPGVPLFDTRSLAGKFVRHRGGMIGLVLAVTMTLIMFAGAGFVQTDPNAIDYNQKLVAPGAEHLLGTDQYGARSTGPCVGWRPPVVGGPRSWW